MFIYSYRNIISNWKKTYLKISLTLLAMFTLGFSQDSDPPEEFEFNISIYQSFYFFLESDIGGQDLEPGVDWIASFNIYDETYDGQCLEIGYDLDGDPETDNCQDLNSDGFLTSNAEICVGSYYWDGPYTTVPVMGVDGTRWTVGYMEENQLPIFKIYDSSENLFYPAVPSMIYPWTPDLNFYVISISVLRDCNEDLGGLASIDDCGNCAGGNTGLQFNYEDIGCGCYEPAPEIFYEDIDGDGFGYGEPQLFCDHPGIGWSENNYDEYPDCYYNIYDCNGDCAGTAFLDECGVCSGGLTNHIPNSDVDCNGICFGFAFLDECDYCVAGDTGLEPCEFISDQPEEFYFQQSTLQAFYFIIDAYIGNGIPIGGQDWIGVFNDDVCVGSVKYDGTFTTVPAMGDDGSDWTEGYMAIGEFPTFQLWDASQNLFYPVNVEVVRVEGSETYPYLGWYPNYYYNVLNFNALVADCNGVLDGGAYFDSCGDCVGGSTGIDPDIAMDCANVCNGEAYFDNCGACVGGTTGLEANLDDQGCGCFLPGPVNYFSDFDNDGFGYGDPQGFCDSPVDGWVDNNLDVEPYCFNPDIDISLVDECGICNGNNEDVDCSGTCFGNAIIDECGVCQGDGSACNSPIAATLNYNMSEDETLEIILEGTDPNNQDISFIIITQPENGLVDVNSFNVIYTPISNFFGQDSFTYQVFNGEYYSDPAFVYIDIEPVNDIPIVNSFNLNLEEDTSLDIQLSGSDIDSDSIEFQIISNPINGVANLLGDNIVYTPINNYYGSDSIQILGYDGTDYSDLATISINITPINDYPVISIIDNAEITEGTTFNFPLSATDIDSEDLFYSVSVDNNASAYVLEGELNISPFSGYNGDIAVTVYVSDGYLTDSVEFTLTVIPVNDPPVLSFIGTQIVDEDSDIAIVLSSDDPEGDDLEYSFNLDNGTGVLEDDILTITPDSNFNGNIELTVLVSDGELSDSETLTINVLPVNDAPYFTTISIGDAQENQEYIQVIEYGDIDNDNSELNLEIGNSLGWLEVSGNTLTGTPSFTSGGEYSIILNLSDSNTSTSIQYDLVVEESNQPPSVSDLNINVNEDASISFSLQGVDFENQNITYSYSNPVNGIVTGNAPNLTYTPNNNFNGEDSFTYFASDGVSDSDIATVEINVVSVNDIPTAESVTFELDDEIFNFNISSYISDLDEDELSFNTVPPSQIENQFSTLMGGTIEYISEYNFIYTKPNADIVADYAIYKVSDGLSESSIEIITFVIDNNRLDSRISPSALSDNVIIMEDSESEITLIGFDVFGFPQDGSAEIIITQDPENGNIGIPQFEPSSTNQIAKWTVSYDPVSNFSGVDEIKYIVSNPTNNDSDSDEGTILIAITEVNDAPTLNSITDQETDEDTPLQLSVIYNDFDNDIELMASSSVNGFSFDFDEVSRSESLLSITSPENYNGLATITINASEVDGDLSVSQIFNLNILEINDPPTLAPLADIAINEDDSILINLVAEDVDYDNLFFSATSDSENILVFVENNLLTIRGDENYFGNSIINVDVFDTENARDSQSFEISISSINDAPVVNDINSEVLEDGIVSIFPDGEDIENDELSFSIVNQPENGAISLVSWFFTYEPNENFNGSDSFTYVAYDGESYSSEATVNIIINPDNDSPTITDVNNKTIDEGEIFLLVIDANDIDQDALEYSAELDENIPYSISGNLLSVIFDENFNGDVEVSISVSDSEFSASDSFVITVIPVNDSPIVLNPIADITLDEDFAPFELDISNVFSDIDEDDLQYSISYESNAINIELNDSNLEFSSYENLIGGPIEVILTADDLNRRLTVSDSFNITIVDVNDAPLASEVSINVDEDNPQIIFSNFNDIDNDNSSISVSIVEQPQHGEASVQGQAFLYNPDSNFIGADFFTYRVFDGDLFSNVSTIFIYVQPSNDPPEISDILDQEISEDSILEIQIDAQDIDMDSLTFNATCDNADISIIDNILTVTPPLNFNGDLSVIVSVTDGEFSDDTEFNIAVLPQNDAPELSNTLIQQMDEDSVLEIQINSQDVDLDPLNFDAYLSSYDNASLDLNEDIITITPNENWFGELIVNVFAYDPSGASDSETIIVNVNSINDSPYVVSSPITEAFEDQEYIYQLNIDDADSDDFYFYFLMSPESMEIDLNGLITWTPTEGILSSGFISVVIWDTDSPQSGVDYPAIQEFEITVNPVNDGPTIVSEPNISAIEDQEYNYQIEVTDIDSEEFIFILENHPEGMEVDSNGLITWMPQEGVISSDYLTVYVYDDAENSLFDFQSFVVIVTPFNDPPIITSTAPTEAMQGVLYQYQIEISDPDDNDFSFQLINAPDGMNIDFSNYLLTWVPEEGGEFGPITLKVFDGGEDYAPAAVEVFNINVDYLSDYITMDFDLHEDNNLISFFGIPDDPRVSSVLEPLGDNANQVITEGLAITNSDNFGWVGSLNEFEATKGYWIGLDESAEFEVEALPTDLDIVYNLHDGYNLVSYLGNDGTLIDDAFPDNMELNITDVLTEGMAATRHPELGWIGSLANTGFQKLKGYWLNNSAIDNIEFSWVIDTDLSNRENDNNFKYNDTPKAFKYVQSTKQAFYFFEDVILKDYKIKNGDWILAYNGDVLVGSRQWFGSFTDVPVMGYDNNISTIGMCEASDIPSFKVYSLSTDFIYDIPNQSIPAWSDLSTQIIEKIDTSIPEKFTMAPAYPNPFNPVTRIEYSIPTSSMVEITIYDLIGRELVKLVNENKDAGFYHIDWDASMVSSGVYFVNMKANKNSFNQKIVLIK